MEAKELRIGNWVEMYKEDSTPFKISASNIVVEYKTNKQGYTRYKPIPLTEEWLLRFGWVTLTGNYYSKYLFKISKGCDCWIFSVGDYNKSIRYVHQLQNLHFALTGEELKLKDNGS